MTDFNLADSSTGGSVFNVAEAEKLATNSAWWTGTQNETDYIRCLRESLHSALAHIRKLEAKTKAQALLIEGKEGLLVAYRLGRQPTEKTWKLLERAEKALAESETP